MVLNDATFEEKFSLTLTSTNIWLFFSTIAVVLIMLTAMAMMYTPLKYLVPGFGEYNYRSQIVAMTIKADSLEKAMEDKALWLNNFTNILTGKVDTTRQRTLPKGSFKKEDINLSKSQ